MQRLCVCVAAFTLCLTYAHGWGTVGHETVASVAEARLKASNPDVLKAAHTLLGGRTLKQEANWADTHRRSKAGKATASWHFANMNLKSYPDTAGECKWEPGDDANAVSKIVELVKTLKDTKQKPADRAFALKMIVHLIGDLHQPLHVGFKMDRGGNQIQGKFLGHKDNLHKIWDDKIIEQRVKQDFGGSNAHWEAYITKSLTLGWKENVPQWQSCTSKGEVVCPADWASGTAKQACKYAYSVNGDVTNRVKGGFNLDNAYFQRVKGAVDSQIAKAALRLEQTLVSVLGSTVDHVKQALKTTQKKQGALQPKF